MGDAASAQSRPGLLVAPTYAATVAAGRRPSLHELAVEWIDAVAFWRDRTRFLTALYAAYHLATGILFVAYFVLYPSLRSVIAVLVVATAIATLYNTVWYHRYCSHRAFTFRNSNWLKLFLWTNPVGFREECYAIPHRYHHARSDEPGDPYGPHLGWLGSYLATESQQKVNTRLGRADYQRLTRKLAHIGFPMNSHEAFQRTGSVEQTGHYLARLAFATLFWTSVTGLIAGKWGALAWIAGVFFYTVLVRDFNYRGHAGLFGQKVGGEPENQIFYGIIAGEWHENHHAHPRLARSGLKWWQLDLPYVLIRLMHAVGIVSRYTSPRETGEQAAGESVEATA